MKNTIIFLALSIISFKVYSKFEHHPHIATSATTLSPGKLAFETTPGAGVGASLFASSLSVGITKRFQAGIVPIFFFIREHRFNINFKAKILERSNFKSTLGYTYIRFKFEGQEYIKINGDPLIVNMHIISPSLNYSFENTGYSLGLSYSHSFYNMNRETGDLLNHSGYEWALDVSKVIYDNYVISFGLGEHQTNSLPSPNSEVFGIGLSFRWLRAHKFLSTPRIGAHFLKSKKVLLLATSDFY
ncbi:hypothetical protein N9O57_01055 [bacterium]|nr:hypothetical protein [bacterium]